MKRIISLSILVVLVVTMTVALTACKKKITCDVCGETKYTEPHDVEILGEKQTICDDCYKDIKEIQDELTK